jgi:hypothetical protein
MAKKTYKTYSLKGLQILLFDECGRQVEVNFKAGAQIDSTAKFSTSDEKVQAALEKCSSFNRDFYIESVREDTPAPAPAAKEEVNEKSVAEEKVAVDGNVVEVADKGEAIEWLKEHNPEAGYTAAKLRSKEAFNAACAENNVKFEFTA